MTTSTTAAQDEFNELMRDKDHDARHPEDRNHPDSDLSDPESDGAAADYLEKVDTDDELDIPPNMRSNYYMPSLRSEANTGPKGVIADAQAFEAARKQARRSMWRKNNNQAASQFNANAQYSVTTKAWHEKDPVSDADSDEEFMKTWRANRLKELGQRIRSRTNSPTRRIYGTLEDVDAKKYLDTIEKPMDTIVVVYVWDDEVDSENEDFSEAGRAIKARQAQIESCMHEVARRNDTVQFIRLPNSIADLQIEGVPAVLAYKRGNMVSSLVPILEKISNDTEISAISLETLFMQHRIL